MMSLTFGLFTQVSGSGPLGPLVSANCGTTPTSNKIVESIVYFDVTDVACFDVAIGM